jgi:PPOX class probable F420-dependent enzyme
MALRRANIRMNHEEQEHFLNKNRTLYLATHGVDGFPHLVAMWYARDADRILMTTYRKSQKVANLLADPRAALLLEDGTTYDTLRGVFLRGDCQVIDDEATALRTLESIRQRAEGPSQSSPEALAGMRLQAKKRVVLVFQPEKNRSWDHSKLGGTY